MAQTDERLVLVMAPESVPSVLRDMPESQSEFDVVLDADFSPSPHLIMFVTQDEWTTEIVPRRHLAYWKRAPIHRYINLAGHAMTQEDVEDMRGYVAGRNPFCERYPSACRDA